jgi:hypothetical protein
MQIYIFLNKQANVFKIMARSTGAILQNIFVFKIINTNFVKI